MRLCDVADLVLLRACETKERNTSQNAITGRRFEKAPANRQTYWAAEGALRRVFATSLLLATAADAHTFDQVPAHWPIASKRSKVG